MFETRTSGVPPAFEEMRIGVARERSRLVSTLASSTAHEFAQWLRVLAASTGKLAQSLASAWSCRCDVRTLQRFDDRMLADIGLGRGEIDCACWRRPSDDMSDPYRPSRTSTAAL
jgi:uncharacterized protein YjiS (DUF1127 family)